MRGTKFIFVTGGVVSSKLVDTPIVELAAIQTNKTTITMYKDFTIRSFFILPPSQTKYSHLIMNI